MIDPETIIEQTGEPETECKWCEGSRIFGMACFVIAGVFLLIGIDFLRGVKGTDNDAT